VAEPAFIQAFLRRFVEVKNIAPASELAIPDLVLPRIVNDPNLPERFSTLMVAGSKLISITQAKIKSFHNVIPC